MAQKDERVQRSKDLIQLLQKHLLVVQNNIVTMDEPAVSFYTPETKQQSKQWVKNSQPALLKAKVHASRTKQMILVFFDAKGVIYTNLVPKGQLLLHPDCPGQIPEGFQREEARHVVAGVY
jgi:hypothetical protein